MKFLSPRRLLIVAVVLALVAAACGDDSDTTPDPTPAPPAATDAPAPDPTQAPEPWKVPIVSDLTGFAAVFGVPYLAGAQARFTEINAAGGIHGRMIDFSEVYDSQSDGTVAPAVYQQALGSDPVMTIGYTISSAALAAESVLDTTKGPIISSLAITGWVTPDPKPWFFTAQTVGIEPMEAVVIKAKQELGSLEGKKIDVVIFDLPSLWEFADGLKTLGEAEGFTVPQVVTTDSMLTPSWVAQAQSILDDDPDLVFIALGGGDVPGFVNALLDAGYEGPIFSALAGNLPEIFEAVDSEQYFAYREAVLPVPGDELTRLAEAAGVLDDSNSTWFSNGYAGATLVAAVLEECGPTCTPEQALETINSIGRVEVPNNATFGPLEASATRHQILTAMQFYTWDAEAKEVIPSGDPVPLGD